MYNWILSNKNEDVLKQFNAMHLVTIIRFLFYFRIFIPKEELSSILQFLTTIRTQHKSLKKVIYLSINGFLIIKHGNFDTYKNLVYHFDQSTTKALAVDIFKVIYEGTTQE